MSEINYLPTSFIVIHIASASELPDEVSFKEHEQWLCKQDLECSLFRFKHSGEWTAMFGLNQMKLIRFKILRDQLLNQLCWSDNEIKFLNQVSSGKRVSLKCNQQLVKLINRTIFCPSSAPKVQENKVPPAPETQSTILTVDIPVAS